MENPMLIRNRISRLVIATRALAAGALLFSFAACQADPAHVSKSDFNQVSRSPILAGAHYKLTSNMVFFFKQTGTIPDDGCPAIEPTPADNIDQVLGIGDDIAEINENTLTLEKQKRSLLAPLTGYCADNCIQDINSKAAWEQSIQDKQVAIAGFQAKDASTLQPGLAMQTSVRDAAQADLSTQQTELAVRQQALADAQAANPVDASLVQSLTQSIAAQQTTVTTASHTLQTAQAYVTAAQLQVDQNQKAIVNALKTITARQKQIDDLRTMVPGIDSVQTPLLDNLARSAQYTNVDLPEALQKLQAIVDFVGANDPNAVPREVEFTFAADGQPNAILRDWPLLAPPAASVAEISRSSKDVRLNDVRYDPQGGRFHFTILVKVDDPLFGRLEINVARNRLDATQLDGRIYFTGEIKHYNYDCANPDRVGYAQFADLSSIAN